MKSGFSKFCAFVWFFGRRRQNEDRGAAGTPACTARAHREGFWAGTQPASALLLPSGAEFSLEIVLLQPTSLRRRLDGGAGEALPLIIPRRFMPTFVVFSNRGKSMDNPPPAARWPPRTGRKSLLRQCCLVDIAGETNRGHHDFFPYTMEYSEVRRCLHRTLAYLREDQESWLGSAQDR